MKNKKALAALMLVPFLIGMGALIYHDPAPFLFMGACALAIGSFVIFIMGLNYLTFGIWVHPYNELTKNDNDRLTKLDYFCLFVFMALVFYWGWESNVFG